jgi:S-adenosylmethionine-diacylgycerolhomoserine-N-methlytransferase
MSATAAAAMDRMYSWQTGIYDFTRRPYLLGRDHLIRALAPPVGGRVLEIGCGTGRNLIHAARRWPKATYFGIDVSNAMLKKARQEIARFDLEEQIRVTQADAVTFPKLIFGEAPFQRIYFSYTLSMISNWIAALEQAVAAIPAGGSLLVADFGDQRGFPKFVRAILRAWLSLFDVTPRDDLEAVMRDIASRHGLVCDFHRLYGGYAFLAALRRPGL